MLGESRLPGGDSVSLLADDRGSRSAALGARLPRRGRGVSRVDNCDSGSVLGARACLPRRGCSLGARRTEGMPAARWWRPHRGGQCIGVCCALRFFPYGVGGECLRFDSPPMSQLTLWWVGRAQASSLRHVPRATLAQDVQAATIGVCLTSASSFGTGRRSGRVRSGAAGLAYTTRFAGLGLLGAYKPTS